MFVWAVPRLTSQCLLKLNDSLADDESQTQQSRILYTTSFSWLERDNSIRIWDPIAGRPQVLREANFQQIGHSIITLFAHSRVGFFCALPAFAGSWFRDIDDRMLPVNGCRLREPSIPNQLVTSNEVRAVGTGRVMGTLATT